MHHDPEAASPNLDDAELAELHRHDVLAARVVAGLMTVIFLIGLGLYTYIAYLVAR